MDGGVARRLYRLGRLETLTVDRSKLVVFDWRRARARGQPRDGVTRTIPTSSSEAAWPRGGDVAAAVRGGCAGGGRVSGEGRSWWSRIVSLTCSNLQWYCGDQMDDCDSIDKQILVQIRSLLPIYKLVMKRYVS